MIDELYEKEQNKVSGLQPKDGICYEVTSREFHELGERIVFRNHQLYVYAVHSSYIGSELVHTYDLKTEGGCKRKKCYNTKLIGASLDAKILSVSNDTVKVCVTVDDSQDKGSAKWFPYSTVYSSPDGTGWYCMPEEGDRVRLYFPNEKEEEGYIISSIHVESSSGAGTGSSAPRSNPDNKSISTKYNKLVEMTPTTITITNNKGMTIKIDDEEGISINSDKNITIQSEEELSIKSRNSNMVVEAPESIELIQGSTKITMKDEVTVQGTKFKVQ